MKISTDSGRGIRPVLIVENGNNIKEAGLLKLNCDKSQHWSIW